MYSISRDDFIAPIFRNCFDNDCMGDIFARLVLCNFSKGAKIYSKDDFGAECYLVHSGKVELRYHRDQSGRRQVILTSARSFQRDAGLWEGRMAGRESEGRWSCG